MSIPIVGPDPCRNFPVVELTNLIAALFDVQNQPDIAIVQAANADIGLERLTDRKLFFNRNFHFNGGGLVSRDRH
jgi:hypothetical protein